MEQTRFESFPINTEDAKKFQETDTDTYLTDLGVTLTSLQ